VLEGALSLATAANSRKKTPSECKLREESSKKALHLARDNRRGKEGKKARNTKRTAPKSELK